jgi:hypothetical protein
MNLAEKVYSLFAIHFAIVLTALLAAMPEMRQLQILLPASGVGLVVNVIMMFIVFRDIFSRRLPGSNGRMFWTILLLICWPAILVYLPLHGFKKR